MVTFTYEAPLSDEAWDDTVIGRRRPRGHGGPRPGRPRA